MWTVLVVTYSNVYVMGARHRLLAVNALTVTVQALDAIDGTPVLDLKPYMTEFGPRGEVRQPAWSHQLMAAYWDSKPGAGT